MLHVAMAQHDIPLDEAHLIATAPTTFRLGYQGAIVLPIAVAEIIGSIP
jgi:hypothetical protein